MLFFKSCWGRITSPDSLQTTLNYVYVYMYIVYDHSVHLVWERIYIGFAFCPIPLFECIFTI